MIKKAVVAIAWALLCSQALAKQPNTEHTFKLGEAKSPTASIGAASMLVGEWQGEAFGQQFEETWNAPSAGTMVGMFKVYDPQKGVSFYELMIIAEEANSITLKVKHFNADFSGWEDKDEFVSMPLVAFSNDELHFDGLSFYRLKEDALDAYVALGSDSGTQEEKLIYRRVK